MPKYRLTQDDKPFIKAYIEHIAKDYADYLGRSSYYDREQAIAEAAKFAAKLDMDLGKKYIRVRSGGSCHSWIVVQATPQFEAGTILKSASWKTPAKNFGRGSIFDKKSYEKRVSWTGAT